MPEFDKLDTDLLTQRQALFDLRTGPRVGDYIIRADGRLQRFTHDHEEHGLQTTCGDLDDPKTDKYGCSFYFAAEGFCDFSGGLDPCVKPDAIIDTGLTRGGPVWFFHHNDKRGSNGVTTSATFRVYRERLTGE